jgi:membrane protein DedA with SNARE-associated domain
MLLFRSEAHVDRWLADRGIGKGAVFGIQTGFRLGKLWYADRLRRGWKPHTDEEAESIFEACGLTGGFWTLRRKDGKTERRKGG